MPSFTPNEADIAEYRQKLTAAVQEKLPGEEILAVGIFQRAGQTFFLIPIIGQIGAVFYMLYQAVQKKRASGLPAHFVVAATPAKVHAFKYRPGGYGDVKLKHEVAVWNRGDIHVKNISYGPIQAAVTFEATEDGKVESTTVGTPKMGEYFFSKDLLDLIGGPGGAPPTRPAAAS